MFLSESEGVGSDRHSSVTRKKQFARRENIRTDDIVT